MNPNTTVPQRSFLRAHKILTVLSVLLSILLAVFFAISMQGYDYAIGHMARGSLPFAAVCVVTALSVLLALLWSLWAKKTVSFREDPAENPVSCFGAVLAAVLSLLCLFAAATSLNVITRPATLSAFLAPFLGVSMVLSLMPQKRFSALRQFSAIAAALAVNLSLFADYFDFTLPLNGPVRNFNTLMKAFGLLYLLSEARFAFGQKSRRPNPAFTILSAALTATVSLGYGLGAAIALPSAAADQSLFTFALYAALGIHAIGRLLSIQKVLGPCADCEDPAASNSETK